MALNDAPAPSNGWRASWRRIPAPVRKTAVAVIGAALVITGIALLVLPGPGLVLIALGVAVLASEFRWAHRAHQRLVCEARRALTWTKQRWARLRCST